MTTTSKLRKILPPFMVVDGLQIDTPKLIQELSSFQLFDQDYTAARADVDNEENLFIKANLACKQFFNGNEEAGYTEINLSKPSYESSKLNGNDVQRDVFAVYRTKRLDPSRPEYSEHADEKKHDLDPKYLTEGSELQKVFNFFKGKPCRVRIARMRAGYHIKPHVDYDPSYIFRYHIPLMTNTRATLWAQVKKPESTPDTHLSDISAVHMPADGRVFWINTGILHWAENNGDTDRFHLLIDVTGDLEQENINQLKAF
jgi:hypothetical protein